METLGRRRWLALAAIALIGLVVAIDATVLNLALPVLAKALSASTADLQWFVDAYTLVIAAMLLPAGLLGDRLGRKRLLVVALVLFGVASLACAYAPSAAALIAARALLGLAAAFLLPLSLSVLPALFSERERPTAVTVVIAMTVAALPIGPVLGGWLLTHAWWGSVFLMNLPVVVVALVALLALLPESRSADRPRLDLPGMVASSGALVGLVFGIIEGGEHGWTEPSAILPLGAGAILLVTFGLWEGRLGRQPGGQPLVDLGLFRSGSFTWGTILAAITSFAMFGALFSVPQYFQAVIGTDAMGAGLRLLPMFVGLVVGGAIADRLASRAGAKATVATGLTLLTAGLAIGATSSVSSGDGFAIGWIGLVGVGLGFALPASMDAALGALQPERTGVGSAVIQAMRQVGGTFGVAVLGSLLNTTYRDRLSVGGLPGPAAAAVQSGVEGGLVVARQLGSETLLASVRAAFVGGMDVLLVVTAVVAAAGALLALAFLPRRSAAARQRQPLLESGRAVEPGR
jgi:MFS transporter, DHA2 family, multidrug resistance protein